MPYKAIIFLLLASIHLNGHAASDIPGSKDHPLISRYPGTHIIAYDITEFDQFALPVGIPKQSSNNQDPYTIKNIEGKITTIVYEADSRLPLLQVFRNFQNATQRSGFTPLFQCQNADGCGINLALHLYDTAASPSFKKYGASVTNAFLKHAYLSTKAILNRSETYISVLVSEQSEAADLPQLVALNIIEPQAMKDDLVSLNKEYLSSSIGSEGRAVLSGMFFDTNKAKLKSDSRPSLQIIADYLKKNSTANVLIVGHTDTSGDYKHNLDLSTQRANAIVDALVSTHNIEKARLRAIGIGPASPITSNSTDEGKAKNRRVEMVLN